MFSKGVSNRVHPLQLDRIFHMLVRDDNASTGWRTWCGYGLAREDAPGQYGSHARLCAKCSQLAADGLIDQTMDESETKPFAYLPGATR